MEEAGDRGDSPGEKERGCVQVSKVSNKIRMEKKPSEADPSAWEPKRLREEGERGRVEKCGV